MDADDTDLLRKNADKNGFFIILVSDKTDLLRKMDKNGLKSLFKTKFEFKKSAFISVFALANPLNQRPNSINHILY